jgi:hypothetical protein
MTCTSVDWWNAGHWLNLPSVASPTGYTINEGAAEIWYRPTTASLNNNSNCPWGMFDNENASGSGKLHINIYRVGGGAGPWDVEFKWQDAFGNQELDPIDTFTPTVDVWTSFRIEFKNNATPGGDAYLRYYRGGSLIYTLDESTWLGGGAGFSFVFNQFKGAILGYFGLFGDTTQFRLYEYAAALDPPSTSPDYTNGCCGEAPGSTSPGSAGTGVDTSPLDPVDPDWTNPCVGGGGGPAAVAPPSTEIWL